MPEMEIEVARLRQGVLLASGRSRISKLLLSPAVSLAAIRLVVLAGDPLRGQTSFCVRARQFGLS